MQFPSAIKKVDPFESGSSSSAKSKTSKQLGKAMAKWIERGEKHIKMMDGLLKKASELTLSNRGKTVTKNVKDCLRDRGTGN